MAGSSSAKVQIGNTGRKRAEGTQDTPPPFKHLFHLTHPLPHILGAKQPNFQKTLQGLLDLAADIFCNIFTEAIFDPNKNCRVFPDTTTPAAKNSEQLR